jgi:drug/metabolite transporter (DMT)-like permease
MDRHAKGILLIILSAIAYSSAGFFTRLIHLDAWTMLFWRGLFAGLMILCVIAAQERGRTWIAFRAISRPGIAAALCSTSNDLLDQCAAPHLGSPCRHSVRHRAIHHRWPGLALV